MSNTLNLTKVHNYVKVPGSMDVRLVSTDHYVRLRDGERPPVFVQRGTVFPEEGAAFAFEDIPSWFWKQAKLVSKEMRKTTGLKKLLKRRKLEKLAAQDAMVEVTAAMAPIGDIEVGEASQAKAEPVVVAEPKPRQGKPWTCEQCGEVLTTLQKGAHNSKHARELKKNLLESN